MAVGAAVGVEGTPVTAISILSPTSRAPSATLAATARKAGRARATTNVRGLQRMSAGYNECPRAGSHRLRVAPQRVLQQARQLGVAVGDVLRLAVDEG